MEHPVPAPTESVLPDIEVIRRAIDGDKDAFTELLQSTYRRMFFVARRILPHDEDIYDALQIAYSKAYRYIDRVWLLAKAFFCRRKTGLRNRRLCDMIFFVE